MFKFYIYEGRGKKRRLQRKLHFTKYSTGELSGISELFSYKPFIKILIFRFTISISRFLIITHFPENFRKFLGKFLHPHLPPLPTPHIIHPHPIPQTMNPLRTLNSLFSKSQFDCIYTFISHTLHIFQSVRK